MLCALCSFTTGRAQFYLRCELIRRWLLPARALGKLNLSVEVACVLNICTLENWLFARWDNRFRRDDRRDWKLRKYEELISKVLYFNYFWKAVRPREINQPKWNEKEWVWWSFGNSDGNQREIKFTLKTFAKEKHKFIVYFVPFQWKLIILIESLFQKRYKFAFDGWNSIKMCQSTFLLINFTSSVGEREVHALSQRPI